ncbi:hypothetical protein MRX96_010405 [Rhipicephalus microplus]
MTTRFRHRFAARLRESSNPPVVIPRLLDRGHNPAETHNAVRRAWENGAPNMEDAGTEDGQKRRDVARLPDDTTNQMRFKFSRTDLNSTLAEQIGREGGEVGCAARPRCVGCASVVSNSVLKVIFSRLCDASLLLQHPVLHSG